MTFEHPDWCTDADDPVAVALWKQRDRKPILDVWCWRHRHRLARLYRLPDRGLVLAIRAFTVENRHLYVGAQDDTGMAHGHAYFNDTPQKPGTKVETRCLCGMHSVAYEEIQEAIRKARRLGGEMTARRSFRPH